MEDKCGKLGQCDLIELGSTECEDLKHVQWNKTRGSRLWWRVSQDSCHNNLLCQTRNSAGQLKTKRRIQLKRCHEKAGQWKDVRGKDKEGWPVLFLRMPRSLCTAGNPLLYNTSAGTRWTVYEGFKYTQIHIKIQMQRQIHHCYWHQNHQMVQMCPVRANIDVCVLEHHTACWHRLVSARIKIKTTGVGKQRFLCRFVIILVCKQFLFSARAAKK